MQLTVNSQVLAAELRLVCKVTPSKPAIPTLAYVLLEADDALRLWATDLEIGFATTCQAQVHEPGRIALPAANFLAMVEQFADGDVSIAVDNQQALVRCGAFKSRLQAFDAEDFPEQPEPEGSTSNFDAAALRQMIGRTRYAINAGNAKTVLQGALLTLTGPAAALAATDGKRLALATTSTEGADARVIIPAKTLDMLEAQPDDGTVVLNVGRRHLFFKTGERLLISRVFDAKFPAYEKIIPQTNDKTVVVGKHALAAALRRVRLVSPESKAMYFALVEGAIHLSSSSAEVGSADEAVPVIYNDAPLKVCVKGDFMLDFLEAAASQSVTISLKDGKSPMLLMDGADHLGVIMLMRN